MWGVWGIMDMDVSEEGLRDLLTHAKSDIKTKGFAAAAFISYDSWADVRIPSEAFQ